MIHKEIEIWKGAQCPLKRRDDFEPTLETYILSGDKKRRAVVICPGGGYKNLTNREAVPIARCFNAQGYHAFILYYSVSPKHYLQPITDCARAMRILRDNADRWNIASDKIAVCGFSAGGHLAASIGVHWSKSYLCSDGNKPVKNRPDAVILSYPVISMKEHGHAGSREQLLGKSPDKAAVEEMSLETQVTQDTAPAFIWHTFQDKAVPAENSLMFASELKKNKVPFELHIFPEGEHGLSMADDETVAEDMEPDAHVAGWFKMCLEWLDIVFR